MEALGPLAVIKCVRPEVDFAVPRKPGANGREQKNLGFHGETHNEVQTEFSAVLADNSEPSDQKMAVLIIVVVFYVHSLENDS